MIIKAMNRKPDDSVIVRWTDADGNYQQADALCDVGVDVPEGAVITDIITTGPSTPTQQVVFTPAWPDALDAPRA